MANVRPASPTARRHPDLHGNAPDKCELALLLVDVINDLSFQGGERLRRQALPAAQKLAALKARAHAAGVPVIYANDNFGRWRSDFSAQVRHVLGDGSRGAEIAELLAPTEHDYFVLKPKHSAFFQTCLGVLLDHLTVRTLLLGGFATDSCVSLTASDAFLRGYGLFVLRDGSAAQTRAAHTAAIAQMTRVLSARSVSCRALSFVRTRAGTHVRLRARS